VARHHEPQTQDGVLILDSGAVLALAAMRPNAQAAFDRALSARTPVVVPAVVVAEVARGGGPRDATVNRVLKTVEITPVTEAVARTAGRLLAAAGSSATIDALVVAEGMVHHHATVLTSDLGDLRALAAAHPGVVVRGL
jgi:predicted nucleic acid-binding protein